MKEVIADFCVRNFFKIVIALIITLGFLYILVPFFMPILLGGILAMAFSPFVHFFIKKGFSRKLSIVVLSLGLFIIGTVPATIVFARGSKVITTFLAERSLIVTKHNTEDRIYAVLDNFSEINNIDPIAVREKFDAFIASAGDYVFKMFSGLITQIPDIILLGLITLLSFYFFLAREEHIRKIFDRYCYFSKHNGDRFITLIRSSCREVFFANVLTGLLQATIVATGAFFCGIGDFFIIFFFTFILSFIPIIGAGPVAFLLAILAFLDQRIGAGISMVVISVIAGVSDNLIRPYLNSLGEVEVPAFIGFLAIIGGVIVMGLPGLFVGPLLASLAFGALPIIILEYFPKSL